MLVKQRGDRDCAVGALAMLAQVAYEDAYVETALVDPPTRGKQGLTNLEVIRVARRLRITLTPTREYDLDFDEGILRVRFSGSRASSSPGGHFVTVRKGIVYCPADMSSTPWEDYFAAWMARGCTLLKEADR